MRARWVLVLMLVGCDGGSDDGEVVDSTSSTSGAAVSTGGESSGSSSSTSGSDPIPGTTTAPDPTSDPVEEGSSSTGVPLPEGPSCSVQVTTHGVLTDPLPRGKTEGVFHPAIADALEDWCGCHTLENNNQNVQHPGLRAPGGTLFMDFEDMSRPNGGGTLGQAMAQAVADYGMPPGSCSFPSDAQTLLEQWFAEGFPDGANFVPQ